MQDLGNVGLMYEEKVNEHQVAISYQSIAMQM
jgi:hypothetical protein